MSGLSIAYVSFHTCPLASPGEGKAGGMNVYVRQLAGHLALLGHRVDIYTREHPGHCGVKEMGPVRVIHLPGGPPDLPASQLYPYLPDFLAHMRRYVAENSAPYDLVHSHYWLSGWVGRHIASDLGVPHVFSYHTLARAKAQAGLEPDLDRLADAVEAHLARHTDLIVAFTPLEKENLRHLFGLQDDRVVTVPCGVDTDLFRPVDASLLKRDLGLDGRHVLLFVGRLEPLKGVDLVISTLAIMDCRDRLHLLVVGGDPSGRELQRLQSLARQLGVERNVTFLGRVEHHQLPAFYSLADVCVVPSYYESFGLAALEAMACGTPVVAYRTGGVPYVVQHTRTGYLVTWRCPEPFANCLEALLFNPSLKREMGRSARTWARTLSWGRVARRMDHAYQRALQRSGVGRRRPEV